VEGHGHTIRIVVVVFVVDDDDDDDDDEYGNFYGAVAKHMLLQGHLDKNNYVTCQRYDFSK